MLVTGLDPWRDVGHWFTTQSLESLAVGLPLAIAVVFAALSFRGIRRVVL